MDNWITAAMIKQRMARNGITLSTAEAENILSKINQQGAYAKHDKTVKAVIWDGSPINGVDVSKGRKRKKETIVEIDGRKIKAIEEYTDPADQFISTGRGHAYLIFVDGRLVGFQPHTASDQGFHALTHPTLPHPITKKAIPVCPCGKKHDIEQLMEKHRQRVVQDMAGNELFTQVLYMAQEIWDSKQRKLSKLLDKI